MYCANCPSLANTTELPVGVVSYSGYGGPPAMMAHSSKKMSKPKASKPKASKPKASKPKASKPKASKPKASKPKRMKK